MMVFISDPPPLNPKILLIPSFSQIYQLNNLTSMILGLLNKLSVLMEDDSLGLFSPLFQLILCDCVGTFPLKQFETMSISSGTVLFLLKLRFVGESKGKKDFFTCFLFLTLMKYYFGNNSVDKVQHQRVVKPHGQGVLRGPCGHLNSRKGGCIIMN